MLISDLAYMRLQKETDAVVKADLLNRVKRLALD